MRNGMQAALAVLCLTLSTPAFASFDDYLSDEAHDEAEEGIENSFDDAGLGEGRQIFPRACSPANATQRAAVNDGNTKAAKFLAACLSATNNSAWCRQLMRPNPSSRSVFACTYGSEQPHQLIHPAEATWQNAFQAVRILQDLEALGVKVQEIYNWWRPEPYNANVGGSKTRHPFGTAVDIRYASLPDMEKAHKLLCQFRKQGRLRALGYYGSTGLHFGVGDANANTWGKSCP
jgi:hypothetical protein